MSQNPELSDQIADAIKSNEVILFMKGTPDTPACGFSARSSAALTSLKVPYASVDILPDARIREELSALSNWPTIPQLFVRGELVGGCDIILEMAESGELQTLLGTSGEIAPEVDDMSHADPSAPPIQIENRLN